MKAKASAVKSATLTCAFLVMSLNVQAKSNSEGTDRSVVVGTLASVDSSGKKFSVQQSGEHLHKLYMNAKSTVYYVGLRTQSEQKPRVGLGVKASCGKGGIIKTITFTPPLGEPAMVGEKRLTMTERELFNEVDKDASRSVSYVEFSKHIYYSPKHGPDSFRKADRDRDGVLGTAEFMNALSGVSWWKLSRQTADEWFLQADKNRDEMLDVEEFAIICTSGNHIENVFKRADEDKSGSLTQHETVAYIRSVTHGKVRKRKKRK
jgi:Ca2+-binding EF-hand superfamily protein